MISSIAIMKDYKNTDLAQNKAGNILSNFAYEVCERIVRFILHLEEIENQFYSNEKSDRALINNYKEVLLDLLGNLCHALSQKNFDFMLDILKCTNELYTAKISILPRPSDPVELTRFERVIHKQILVLAKKENENCISISMNEEIGEEVEGDYLSSIKNRIELLKSTYNVVDNNFVNQSKGNNEEIHINIPRIDASNTFRWPSIIHEIAHTIFRLDVYPNEPKKIVEEFKTEFSNGENEDSNLKAITDFFGDEKLRSWLEESWCDLFACILIGPAFYFSQYLAFINPDKEYDENTHPPCYFRRTLIEAIIKHRFPSELCEKIDGYCGNCEDIIDMIHIENERKKISEKSDQNEFDKKIRLWNITCNYFTEFFISYFFQKEGHIQVKGHTELSERLTQLISKFFPIDINVIEHLKRRLESGLPIPSIRTLNINKKYEELPTYVQEIFLTSWLSRNDKLKTEVLEIIETFNKKEVIWKLYKDIREKIVRHDQAILKSIQVSEWFDLLSSFKENNRPSEIEIYPNKPKKRLSRGLLVDTEIKSLIYSDELKVIPLVYMEEEYNCRRISQIGTTSLDIRLGTCFQVFYPNEYGIIDFVQENDNKNFRTFSKRMDLDIAQGITITPGQFLLAHSMEYVKLPNYICGNLEGRSSFARLGIEIHMTAGFIDPGFEGVITLEIYNAGSSTVMLYPGTRVGQIRFEKCNNPEVTYDKKDVKYKGLLEHDLSRQSRDVEVEFIRKRKEEERRKEDDRKKKEENQKNNI